MVDTWPDVKKGRSGVESGYLRTPMSSSSKKTLEEQRAILQRKKEERARAEEERKRQEEEERQLEAELVRLEEEEKQRAAALAAAEARAQELERARQHEEAQRRSQLVVNTAVPGERLTWPVRFNCGSGIFQVTRERRPRYPPKAVRVEKGRVGLLDRKGRR